MESLFKRVAIGCLVTALLSCGFVAGWKARPSPSASETRLLAIVSQAAAERHDIVVIGDSLTEYAPIDAICPGALNAGIAGSTTAEAVAIAEAIIPAARPRVVLLAVGTNDAVRRTSVNAFTADHARLRTAASRFGATVVTVNIPPVARQVSGGAPADTFMRIGPLNDTLRSVHPIDLFSIMADQDGFLPSGAAQPDGVHLSRTGYALWRQAFGETCSSHARNSPTGTIPASR